MDTEFFIFQQWTHSTLLIPCLMTMLYFNINDECLLLIHAD